MRLYLKNVGKVSEADIKLDGITVIAGENNTGKSTVGKMLYCLFDSFYREKEQIDRERKKTIARVISDFYTEATNRFTMGFNPEMIAGRINAESKDYIADKDKLERTLGQLYREVDKNFLQHVDQESLRKLTDRVYNYLNFPDDEIRKVILKKRLDAEFRMKVGYINNPEDRSEVELQIKDKKISLEISYKGDITIKDYISLVKEIIYIDDPFVLDDIDYMSPFGFYNAYSHRIDLLQKLSDTSKASEFSALDELVVNKKFEKILETMKDVCDGELISMDDRGTYVYKTDRLSAPLDIVNMSTGLKSFVILRTLLEKGRIDENGVVILDEPEIHLHPEWQLKFAEIIVLIQREFKTNILLNTHSPYFLNAIEVYSEKYGIGDVCNYYLTKEQDGRTDIVEVTDNRELIYAKLARPLQDLENMEYRNGETV